MSKHPTVILRDATRYFMDESFTSITPLVRLEMIKVLKIQFSQEVSSSLIDWITDHGAVEGNLKWDTESQEWLLTSEDFQLVFKLSLDVVNIVSANGEYSEEDLQGFYSLCLDTLGFATVFISSDDEELLIKASSYLDSLDSESERDILEIEWLANQPESELKN